MDILKRVILIVSLLLVACGGGGGGGGNSNITPPSPIQPVIPNGMVNLGSLPNGSVVYSSSANFTVTDSGAPFSGTIGIVGGDAANYNLGVTILGPNGSQSLPLNKSLATTNLDGFTITASPSPCTLNPQATTSCQISITANDAMVGSYTLIPTFTNGGGSITKENSVACNVLGVPGQLSLSSTQSTLLVGDVISGSAKLTGSNGIESVNVSLSSSESSVATISPSSCVLSTANPSCNYTVSALGSGTTSISASAPTYGVQSMPLVVNSPAPIVKPGNLILTVVNSALTYQESTSATLELVGAQNVAAFTVNLAPLNSLLLLSSPSCQLSSDKPQCLFTATANNTAGTTAIIAQGNGYKTIQTQLTVATGVIPGTLSSDITTNSLVVGNSVNGNIVLNNSQGVATTPLALTSSDPSVLTVTPQSGNISTLNSSFPLTINAVGAGNAQIIASGGGYTISVANINVTSPLVPGSLQLNLSASTVVQNQSVSGQIKLSGSSGVAPFPLQLTSSDSGIASIVSSNCDSLSSAAFTCDFTVQTYAAGTVQISAAGNGYAISVPLTVTPQSYAGNLAISLSTNNIYTQDGASALAYIFLSDSSGISAVNATVTSSNPNIATVESKECPLSTTNSSCPPVAILPKSTGYATISVSAPGYITQSESIGVNESAVPGHLVLSVAKTTINVGETTLATITLIGSKLVTNLNAILTAQSIVLISPNGGGCFLNSTGPTSCTYEVKGNLIGNTVLQVYRTTTPSVIEAQANIRVTKPLTIAYLANIGLGGGALGGVSGADKLCQNAFGSSYKALISDANTRKACVSANCGNGGSAENVNWVLQPLQNYYNESGPLIGTTNESAIFTVSSFTNPISTNPAWALTGLNGDWTSSGNNCGAWSNVNAPFGTVGLSETSGVVPSISYVQNEPCYLSTWSNRNNGLYCVQQLN